MRSILVPTDFSENANTAIEYACELAKSLSAEVLITNIYTPAITQRDIVSPLVKGETERTQNTAEGKLKSICKIVQEQYGPLNCNYKFVVGGVVESIDKLVSENNTDLVVMGTRGASGLNRILFGSNTTRVIEKVKCPVLAVPRDSPFQPPKKIIYATDFNNSELNHIEELVNVAKAFSAQIMITHITTDKEALESEEMLKRNFAKQVGAITDYKNIEYFVKYEDDISRALESLIIQVSADWITLLTHKRSLFEKLYNPSLTKAMAYHTQVPLLAIKN